MFSSRHCMNLLAAVAVAVLTWLAVDAQQHYDALFLLVAKAEQSFDAVAADIRRQLAPVLFQQAARIRQLHGRLPYHRLVAEQEREIREALFGLMILFAVALVFACIVVFLVVRQFRRALRNRRIATSKRQVRREI